MATRSASVPPRGLLLPSWLRPRSTEHLEGLAFGVASYLKPDGCCPILAPPIASLLQSLRRSFRAPAGRVPSGERLASRTRVPYPLVRLYGIRYRSSCFHLCCVELRSPSFVTLRVRPLATGEQRLAACSGGPHSTAAFKAEHRRSQALCPRLGVRYPTFTRACMDCIQRFRYPLHDLPSNGWSKFRVVQRANDVANFPLVVDRRCTRFRNLVTAVGITLRSDSRRFLTG
jgi:hypothetical protein